MCAMCIQIRFNHNLPSIGLNYAMLQFVFRENSEVSYNLVEGQFDKYVIVCWARFRNLQIYIAEYSFQIRHIDNVAGTNIHMIFFRKDCDEVNYIIISLKKEHTVLLRKLFWQKQILPYSFLAYILQSLAILNFVINFPESTIQYISLTTFNVKARFWFCNHGILQNEYK